MKAKLYLLLIILTLSSCQKEKSYNFTLYLNSNTSNCQTFKISIDDQVIYNDEFCPVSTMPKIIESQIKTGHHILKAEAVGVSELFQEVIDFSDEKAFGYLTYNQNTLQFNYFQNSTGGID